MKTADEILSNHLLKDTGIINIPERETMLNAMDEFAVAFAEWCMKNVTYSKDGFTDKYIKIPRGIKYFLHTGKWRGYYNQKQLLQKFKDENK